MNTNNPMPPKTWLAESILATLFCCLPFGIVGIVHAAKVDSLFQNGMYEQAQKASEEAGKWTKISFWLGLVGGVLYAVLVMAGVVGGAFYGL